MYAALLGKLQEHEIEPWRLEKQETQEKKHKSIDLKVDLRVKLEEDISDEEETSLFL